MKTADIIQGLQAKLEIEVGRHLYGIIGSYPALETFAGQLRHAKMSDGRTFPKPISVNRGILAAIPDEEFRSLAENEARRPEPTTAHVRRAFEKFLRGKLARKKDKHDFNLIVLANLEMLFAYRIELELLRTLATDDDRILLLLPGRRDRGGRVVMYPELGDDQRFLPTNLIAEDHLWTLKD
jgi:hypothetical protein